MDEGAGMYRKEPLFSQEQSDEHELGGVNGDGDGNCNCRGAEWQPAPDQMTLIM